MVSGAGKGAAIKDVKAATEPDMQETDQKNVDCEQRTGEQPFKGRCK